MDLLKKCFSIILYALHNKLTVFKLLKGFVYQHFLINTLEPNSNLTSFSINLCRKDLKFFVVSAGREYAIPHSITVLLASLGLIYPEGPLVPGTADTERPVREDLNVPLVEWAASVRTPAAGRYDLLAIPEHRHLLVVDIDQGCFIMGGHHVIHHVVVVFLGSLFPVHQ